MTQSETAGRRPMLAVDNMYGTTVNLGRGARQTDEVTPWRGSSSSIRKGTPIVFCHFLWQFLSRGAGGREVEMKGHFEEKKRSRPTQRSSVERSKSQ